MGECPWVVTRAGVRGLHQPDDRHTAGSSWRSGGRSRDLSQENRVPSHEFGGLRRCICLARSATRSSMETAAPGRRRAHGAARCRSTTSRGFCATKEPSRLLASRVPATRRSREWSRACAAARSAICRQRRMLMMSKLFQCLFVIAAAGVVLPGCMESPMPDPVSEIEIDTSRIVDDEASLRSGCCIDYYCPANDFEITSCGSPGPAFRACAAACGTYCETGGWFCD